jgi:hypothetical protein
MTTPFMYRIWAELEDCNCPVTAVLESQPGSTAIPQHHMLPYNETSGLLEEVVSHPVRWRPRTSIVLA